MDYSMFFETNSDRRRRFSNEVHNYHDDGVLLGYWFDERARKEIESERLMKAFAKNELPFQKLERFVFLLSKPVKLTRNLDGFLHHGDIVRLKWQNQESKMASFLAALPENIAKDNTLDEPCWVTATEDARIMARNSFYMFRNNNFTPNHVPIMYGEMIMVCTLDGTGHRLLNSEPRNLTSFAKKTGHNEVTFAKELSGRGLWRILSAKKNDRLETDGKFIPCNTDLVIQHVASGQNLAVEKNSVVKTVLGWEREVSVHSYQNKYKMDDEENIWQIEAPLIKPDSYSEPIELPGDKN